ncbi:WYL domain-containing protein [Haloferula sargassicola]|uniref:WYL domain-containing protein n=1 Tax=Haloferula sargassicola TaxID=490096 RepID=A0ABP9UP94_9BACT
MSYPLRQGAIMKSLSRRRFATLLAAFAGLPAAARCAETGARKIAPVSPVRRSDDPVVSTFLRAITDEETIAIYYHGGTNPGALRRFRPISIYRVEDGAAIYAHGYCQLRGEPRTLRLDKIRLA